VIFPGMDPYLEDPQIWAGVHSRLIVYIADYLQPLLTPRYIAAIQERVFVEGPNREIIPDVWLKQQRCPEAPSVAVADTDVPVEVQIPALEVHETYIAILDRASGQQVVTVIEVVSPTNKFPGPGQKSYKEKQREVLHSQTHLVEIDLLRAGQHVLAVPEWTTKSHGPYDYLISVNRAQGMRDRYQFYPRTLRQRLPRIQVPLAEGDPDVRLDLQSVLSQTYEAGSYGRRLNYGSPCLPPLAPEDQDWATQLVQEART
jgi:hypothetical protein